MVASLITVPSGSFDLRATLGHVRRAEEDRQSHLFEPSVVLPTASGSHHPSLYLRRSISRYLDAGSRQLSSGKVPDTHSVGAICNHNLGVFIVTKITMENTGAVSPAHPVPRTPKGAYPGLQRCRGPSAPLTCLARPAAWQSLCTGHVDASLKAQRSDLHRRDRPSGR